MSNVQFATRVDEKEAQRFRAIASQLGTTPPDALRMFIAAFNACGGFPYEVKVSKTYEAEPFENEAEATSFATSLATGLSRATR